MREARTPLDLNVNTYVHGTFDCWGREQHRLSLTCALSSGWELLLNFPPGHSSPAAPGPTPALCQALGGRGRGGAAFPLITCTYGTPCCSAAYILLLIEGIGQSAPIPLLAVLFCCTHTILRLFGWLKICYPFFAPPGAARPLSQCATSRSRAEI